MKGISGWGYRPYRPFDRAEEAELPFICRLVPGEDYFELEWFDHGCDGGHALQYRLMKSYEPWTTVRCGDRAMRIDGLTAYTDYELRIIRCDDESVSSAVRYVRTGKAPGTVVNYLHPEDTLYAFSGRSLCSPSLVKLPSGALLASMDVFAGEYPQNLTLVFRSDDGGKNWRYVTDMFPCYWGTLFVHRGRLYMLAVTTEYGDLMIAESRDEGATWGKPSVLFCGSGMWKASGWQHPPLGFVAYNGRMYTSIDYGAWSQGGHGICQLSVAEDADLLDSENWTVSPPLKYSAAWPGAPKGLAGGLLEGSIVVDPEGRLLNIVRLDCFNCTPNHGLAVRLEANPEDPEEKLAFRGFVELPSGSNCKTHIRKDPESDYYVAVGNLCVDSSTPRQRNVAAMMVSKDLVRWEIAKVLLDYRHMNAADVGFQYLFFLFDGDDIIFVSRTAFNNARNFHDANYQTFHRVENFRQYLK